MQTLHRGYKALELLSVLNLDRALALLVLGGALFLAAYVGTPQ
ncbi:MAG: hypothetical protein OXQ92_12100 [Boseongicola sp.]|nr:hypothetical protein [Boseongicola sp.]MDD9976571.1 hypothetical protein [Boseongicola sp.]